MISSKQWANEMKLDPNPIQANQSILLIDRSEQKGIKDTLLCNVASIRVDILLQAGGRFLKMWLFRDGAM